MKYILYCRKSTDEKDKQVLSIEAQITELKEFAKREHLEITEIVSEAKTAKTPGREEFAEVLRKIEKGEAQGILSWHPDRLARNSIDGGKIIYLLDIGKLLDLKFPSFWFESTPQGKFMLSIPFGQSKYYVDNLSENVKRGLRQKLRNGVFPSRAPVGYVNNLITRSIDLDPEKAKIVKKAFQIFAGSKVSFVSIARFLYAHGITRTGGKPYKVDRVKYMLTYRFYTGIFKYNCEYYEGSHKPLISKQLFARVQKQVEKIERPRLNGHNFAFSGLARCGECGATITAEQHIKKYKKGTSQTFIYYRCTKKLKPCSQKYIQEPELENQLLKIVSDVVLPVSWGKQWFEMLEKDEIEEKKLSEENIIKLTHETEELDRKLNLLLDSYLDQVIDTETYKKKKNEIFEEKLKITEEITKIKSVGSSWLEPFQEFVEKASQLEKIARAKKNSEDLAIFAQMVGSDFRLENRQLRVEFKEPFAALRTRSLVPSAFASPSANSLSVEIYEKVRTEFRKG